MGGPNVAESVFGCPGFGRLLLPSIQRRDGELIRATAPLVAVIDCRLSLVAHILSKP